MLPFVSDMSFYSIIKLKAALLSLDFQNYHEVCDSRFPRFEQSKQVTALIYQLQSQRNQIKCQLLFYCCKFSFIIKMLNNRQKCETICLLLRSMNLLFVCGALMFMNRLIHGFKCPQIWIPNTTPKGWWRNPWIYMS